MIHHPHLKSQPNIKIDSKVLLKHQISRNSIKNIGEFCFSPSDEVGCGLTSRVYKGKNNKTNEFVAIKAINKTKNQGELQKNFLTEEIEVLKTIKGKKCENLLKMEAIIEEKDDVFIVTEYCEGKDLGKLLRAKERIFQFEAQSIMKQLIKAYKDFYSLGYVHRDLKLSNLFVKKGKLKLADFGFAIEEFRTYKKFTYNVGSPYYMAPQTLSQNRYNVKSDIWAIGVIAFQLVYGKAPWKDKVDEKLLEKITSTSIADLFSPNIHVSEEYKEFIKKCLCVDPKQRASSDFIFNFYWPLALSQIEGMKEDIKRPLMVEMNGHRNSLQEKENRQRQKEEIKVQRKVLGSFNYCQFLVSIYKELKEKNIRESKGIKNQIVVEVTQKMAQLHRICDAHINSSAGWNELRNILGKASHENKTNLTYQPVLRRIISSPNIQSTQFDFRKTLFSFLQKNFFENEKKISILVEFYRMEDLWIGEENFLQHYEAIFEKIKNICCEKMVKKSTNGKRIWQKKII